jgi:hypothetical protein
MYPSQEEANKYKGKRAEAPHYSRLLLVDEKSGSTNAGKGKVLDEGDMEGTYSSDEENGMEVDRVEPDNPVSNIVTISDVNEGISAQTFRMMTADVFSNSNARPLVILRARGLIWVRFVDVTSGRRGFGALGAVWRNLRVEFQPNGEFDETALYTTDVWLREEQDDDSPAPPYTPAPPAPAVTRPPAQRPFPVLSAEPAAQSWGGTLDVEWVVGSQNTVRPYREVSRAGGGKCCNRHDIWCHDGSLDGRLDRVVHPSISASAWTTGTSSHGAECRRS